MTLNDNDQKRNSGNKVVLHQKIIQFEDVKSSFLWVQIFELVFYLKLKWNLTYLYAQENDQPSRFEESEAKWIDNAREHPENAIPRFEQGQNPSMPIFSQLSHNLKHWQAKKTSSKTREIRSGLNFKSFFSLYINENTFYLPLLSIYLFQD